MADGAIDRSHAALMNATYRHQRRIYDLSRKYFLFGRDRLIQRLAPPEGGTVLEVACGTGRNLAVVDRHHPGRQLFGLDISSEMLSSAGARLGPGARLAEADACRFEARTLWPVATFDRVILSYALSMIPDWHAALSRAADHVAPGGALHIVDFADQAGWPGWFGRGLRAWLARFHVTPRIELADAARTLAAERGWQVEVEDVFGRYAQRIVLTRPAGVSPG